jgi:hypothetical protein
MEPLSKTVEGNIGNYCLVASLKDGVITLEMISLIDRQPYAKSYHNDTMSS